MPWFQDLCRNVGLAVHNVKQPIKEDAAKRTSKQIVKQEIEEKQLDATTILRRTVIEEIEMKPGADPSKLKKEQDGNKA